MMPLQHLHEQYDSSFKLGDEVHLFWSLTSFSDDEPSSLDQANEGGSSDVNEIQFAIAYNLPNLALHDDNHDEDGHDLKQEYPDNMDKLNEDDVKEHGTINNYWLAFGISPQGGMIGADFMIYLPHRHSEKQQRQEPMLLDAHGIQYSFPLIDSCGQDWALLNSSIIPNEDECYHHPCEGCDSTST